MLLLPFAFRGTKARRRRGLPYCHPFWPNHGAAGDRVLRGPRARRARPALLRPQGHRVDREPPCRHAHSARTPPLFRPQRDFAPSGTRRGRCRERPRARLRRAGLTALLARAGQGDLPVRPGAAPHRRRLLDPAVPRHPPPRRPHPRPLRLVRRRRCSHRLAARRAGGHAQQDARAGLRQRPVRRGVPALRLHSAAAAAAAQGLHRRLRHGHLRKRSPQGPAQRRVSGLPPAQRLRCARRRSSRPS